MIRHLWFSQPADGAALRPAIFLDRDGTLTEYRGWVTRPEQIQLVPGAADALKTLQQSGFCCVLVTNQSAIGRGLLTEAELTVIHDELRRQLAIESAAMEAFYWCPDAPVTNDDIVMDNPDRKPGPGMLLRAAEDLRLDLSQSWMIGDRRSDMLAGRHAGCRGSVHVRSACPESAISSPDEYWFHQSENLPAAVEFILSQPGSTQTGSSPAQSGLVRASLVATGVPPDREVS